MHRSHPLKETDYDASLAAIELESSRLNSSGFANFMHLHPRGGYHATGTDLFVYAVDLARWSNHPCSSDQTRLCTPPIDTSATIYEVQARETYDVGPFVSLASVPFLGDVPALGKPVQFTVNWNRTSEFPQGLSGVSAIASRPIGKSGFNGPRRLKPLVAAELVQVTVIGIIRRYTTKSRQLVKPLSLKASYKFVQTLPTGRRPISMWFLEKRFGLTIAPMVFGQIKVVCQ